MDESGLPQKPPCLRHVPSPKVIKTFTSTCMWLRRLTRNLREKADNEGGTVTEESLMFLGVSPDEEEMYRLLLRRGGFSRTDLERHLQQDAREGDAPGRADHVPAHDRPRLATETPGGLLAPVSPPAKAVEALIEARSAGDAPSWRAKRPTVASSTRCLANTKNPWTPALNPTRPVEPPRGTSKAWPQCEPPSTNSPSSHAPRASLPAHRRPQPREHQPRQGHGQPHPAPQRTHADPHAAPQRSMTPTTMDYLRELTAKGAKVRIAYEPLERLIICDRAAALTPIDPAETTKGGAILTRDPGLVAALVSLFERMWQTAHDLPTIEESEDKGTSLVNGLQRDILRSLYTSEKDEIGARELGIAVRTYRKHVASLMQRLGASNRFQAALLARERGWI